MKLEVCWAGKPNEIKTMEAENNETVRSLKERACVEFECDPAKTEIWDFFHNSKYAKLEDVLDRTLAEARILDDQPILLDDKASVEQLMGSKDALIQQQQRQIDAHKVFISELRQRIAELEAGGADEQGAAAGLKKLAAPAAPQGGSCAVCAVQQQIVADLKQQLQGVTADLKAKEAELTQALINVAVLQCQLSHSAPPTPTPGVGSPCNNSKQG